MSDPAFVPGGLRRASHGLALLLGLVGHLDLREQTNLLAERWTAWRDQPEPRFSLDRRLNQPWLNPHSPPLVLAFNYDYHLRDGTKLEAGGVGGLIESGYFASLLLPDHANVAALGGKLDRYFGGETVTGMTIYRRLPGPAPR